MLESVLDSAREAVCIISAEGRLDLMSPLTREWLTQGVHLRVRRNALQHADQSAHQRFLATVGAVPGDGTPRWTVTTRCFSVQLANSSPTTQPHINLKLQNKPLTI
jgi:hypothetical protein